MKTKPPPTLLGPWCCPLKGILPLPGPSVKCLQPDEAIHQRTTAIVREWSAPEAYPSRKSQLQKRWLFSSRGRKETRQVPAGSAGAGHCWGPELAASAPAAQDGSTILPATSADVKPLLLGMLGMRRALRLGMLAVTRSWVYKHCTGQHASIHWI
eukprot:1153319-Pelagomonas_calceolata.AAC.2